MRASALEFRLRVVILFVIVVVGFCSPWIGAGRRISLLEWLSLELGRAGVLRFTAAIPTVIGLSIVLALIGAVLRVWGTASLGPGVVNHVEMQAGAVVAAGPYRYVRNPLYLGSLFMFAAMAFAMPPTGALFALLLIAFFQMRLNLGEEAFLTAQLGEPYRAYLRSVPRLFPRLRSNLPVQKQAAQWGRAVLAELQPIGIVVIFAALTWRYDNWLLIKAIVINFGVSLVARALVPAESKTDAMTV